MLKDIVFRRHTLWLPRLWFLLLLMLLSTLLVFFCVKNLAYYLALTNPAHGKYLVVEGWLDEDSLDQALRVFRRDDNEYQYLVTTGGPDLRHNNAQTYAEQSANYFMLKGLSAETVIVVSTPASAQARTFLSAVMVREWFERNHIEDRSMDVFTGSVHARRTHTLYEKAFGSKCNIGIYASSPSRFQLADWWKTSDGAKTVITEALGLLWANYFFEPGEAGSHEEKWGNL